MRISRFVGLLSAMALSISIAGAAIPPTLTGTVKDQSGAVVPDARVTLRTAQGAIAAATSSDQDGRFSFSAPSGNYELHVEKQNLGITRQAVTLREDARAIDVVLRPTAVITELTVTAETGQAVDLERVAQRVNVIAEDTLQHRAKATLAQVAQEEVGLNVQKTSPTVGQVIVRGLTDVGVYIDGVRWTQSTQRGGISTFFNLNEPTSFQAVEVLRGPNGAQYGSDSLAGTVQLLSRVPNVGVDAPVFGGEFNTSFNSADLSYGSNALLSYGTRKFGALLDLAGRRHNTLRPGGGIDTHAAVTRFLGLPSDIFGERLPGTAFTQYAGTMQLAFVPTPDQQISFRYQRGQQDGSRRYDQLLGGDGNLIADLRNMQLDFGYIRYQKQKVGWFDLGSAAASYNSQREQRVNQGGQGNPNADIISDTERTTTWGFNFFLNKQLQRHSIVIGSDIYRDGVDAPSFSYNPATLVGIPARPRVPNGARFLQYGFFVQDAFDLIAQRLRFTGALRYHVASYRAQADDAPVVGGQPLFPDDSLRAADLSGRAGLVLTAFNGGNFAFQYSRGFRAPNITALGSVGLVGVGFQVAASELAGRNATIGSTGDVTAIDTGIPVSPLVSETTNNYDASFTLRRGPVQASLGGFFLDYANTISRQTLILPAGAVGTTLGSQTITQQDPSGAVYVPLSTSPVLVQVNFGESSVRGLEAELKYQFTRAWSFGSNYTYIYAEDENGKPPNTEAGTLPPPTATFRLRYQPAASRYWVEAYSIIAGRQDRISTLGLGDRRTGATRSRQQIQNFFRRGATVRGLINPGADGTFGNADDILISTGETLAQVQDRVLGVGIASAPLFSELPGYGYFGVRGGVRVSERSDLFIDFENIADKNYRNASWGMPGSGRSINLQWKYRF